MEWVHRGAESGGITLGSWPDWLAAIATGLAFLIAAISYARSTRDHRQSQSRLVYATFKSIASHPAGMVIPILPEGVETGYGEGTVVAPGLGADGGFGMITTAPIMRATDAIHNGSDELIHPVKLQLRDTGLDRILDRISLRTGPVEPHTEHLVDISVINEHFPGEPGISPVIIFRDSSGRWWKRHEYEPIERIHDDPNNTAETAAERAERAERIKRLGLGEIEPEPKVTYRVQFFRLLRRLRRKQPLP